MSDQIFKRCVSALDDVTAAFRNGRSELKSAPTRYEADFAAFKLMQQVWLHVNAVSHISALPYTGSHLASAWVLLRAAFETGVIALWLAMDDDWREREARWLGWATTEEEHWGRLRTEFQTVNPGFADRISDFVDRVKKHREAITKRLPKDSRVKRPNMPQLMNEVGIERRYYIAYRVGSQLAHGGAGMDEFVVREEEDMIHLAGAVTPSQWKDPFRMAGWSVAQPGVVVLGRAGVSQEALDRLVSCHNKLLEITEELTD